MNLIVYNFFKHGANWIKEKGVSFTTWWTIVEELAQMLRVCLLKGKKKHCCYSLVEKHINMIGKKK